MKKLLVLAAALLLMVPATAMAGMTAFMDMDELSANELASTQGQAGITINATITITGGNLAWSDPDGFLAGDSVGVVTLHDVTSTGVNLNGLTIDACTTGAGVSSIVVGIPSMTLNQSIAEVRVGSVVDGGESLGQLDVQNLALGASTLRISAHAAP